MGGLVLFFVFCFLFFVFCFLFFCFFVFCFLFFFFSKGKRGGDCYCCCELMMLLCVVFGGQGLVVGDLRY